MVNKITLSRIYNIAPSNLGCFPNPLFQGRRQRFLTDQEMVSQAKKILALIEQKEPGVILYSDTGAWPLAYICQLLVNKLEVYKKLKGVAWSPIKCPRESAGKYEDVILSMLSPIEKTSMEALIRENSHELNKIFYDKAESPLNEIIVSIKKVLPVNRLYGEILRSTRFSKLLSGDVVYLDEYIDSGVTLSNTYNVLRCFNPEIKINIVAYHIFASTKDLENNSIVSLYTNDDGIQAFLPGVYPYENRLDIIGKYYVRGETELKEIDIPGLWKKLREVPKNNVGVSEFINTCVGFIKEKKLQDSVGSREFIDDYEILRYLLYLFEDNLGDDKINSELLWSLFDMFGPAWSPLPDIYHLDFWKGFSSLKKDLVEMSEFKILSDRYKSLRQQIIREVVRISASRHRKWKFGINKIISNNNLK